MELTMSRHSGFWNFIAKRYARSPVSDEAAYQKKLEITRKYLKPGMQLLEFGCGTGSTAITQSAYVKHIQAIDFSPKMLEIAQARADAAGVTNVTFECAGIDDYPVPDERFDVVMGHSILHLLADRDPVIAKVFELLKPGGVFVSSTVCMGGKAGIMRFIMPVGRSIGLLPMLRFFTVDELITSITDAGFDIDHKSQPNDDGVFIVAQKPG